MALNIYQQMMQGRQAPNAAQAIGGGLRMAGQAVDKYGEEMTEAQKLNMLLQEMTQKRTQALLEARRSEVEMGILQEEQEEKKRVRDTRQKGREAIFKKRVAETPPGMGPSPEDMALLELDPLDQAGSTPPTPSNDASLGMGMPDTGMPRQRPAGPMPMGGSEPPYIPEGVLPEQGVRGGQGMGGHPSLNPSERLERDPSRDEQLRTAFEHELIDGGDYFQHTDPSKSPEFILGKLATQAGYNLSKDEDRREFQWKLAMLLEGGRNDRAAAQDRSKPKTASGMPLRPIGDTELKKITDIRNAAWNIGQVKGIAAQISDLAFGPIAGRATGRNPYDSLIQRLENAVNATVPSLARGVYGEVGVLTDQDREAYTKLLPNIRKNPAVARWIVHDLEKKIAAAWSLNIRSMEDAGRDIGAFDPDLTFDDLANVKKGGGGAARQPRPAPGAGPAPRGAAPADTAAQDMDIIRQIKAQRQGGGKRK